MPAGQVALAWLLAKPVVTAPIVGATKLDHLEETPVAEELSSERHSCQPSSHRSSSRCIGQRRPLSERTAATPERVYRIDVRVLVLQHIACEPPGVYEDVLRERGAELVGSS